MQDSQCKLMVALRALHRLNACAWSFYIRSGGGTPRKLLICDFDLEIFQEFRVFHHFLA